MSKTLIIVLISLAVLAGLIGVYFFANKSDSASLAVLSPRERQCQSDAGTFFYKYKVANGDPITSWEPTQSHFNTKLSVCLTYLGSVTTINNSTNLHNNQVIDTKTGKTILLSITKKTCSTPDSCTEELNESLIAGVPSFGSKYFFTEMKKLMED